MSTYIVCNNCSNNFISKDKRAKYCSLKCVGEHNGKRLIIKGQTTIANYNNNPNYCKECNKPLQFNKKSNKFCNKSCSASFYMKKRKIENYTESKETREKRSKTIKNKSKKKNIPEIFAPYTKVYFNTCAKTGIKFYSKNFRKYSSKAIYSDRKLYANQCKFIFPFSFFSEEEINLLRSKKIYHPIKNPGGVSRDHLFSISDGWNFSVDPEIMKHPANCRLITHLDNQSKHCKSIITLEELYNRIKEWKGIEPS